MMAYFGRSWGGEIIVQGLCEQDPKGDKRLIPLLQAMGADIILHDRAVIV